MDQTPQLDPEGAAQSMAVYPIFRLPDQPTAEVRVRVDPAAGTKDLRRVRLSAEEPPQWNFLVPRLEGAPPSLPVTGRLPLGLRVTARCSVRSGSSWELVPPRFDFEVTGDRTLSFVLQPRAPEPVRRSVSIRQSDYGYAPPFPPPTKTGAYGVEGDDGFLAGEPLRGIRKEWPGSLGVEAPEERTAAEPEGPTAAPAPPQPELRLSLPPGGARSLAGFVAGRSVIWVGSPGDEPAGPLWRRGSEPGRLSLDRLELDPTTQVEPGPVRVRLDLPWGSWATVIQVPEEGETVVSLPASVGTPPLRVALHQEAGRRGTWLLGVEGPAPPARLRRGLAGPAGPGLEPGTPRSAAWALRPPALGTGPGCQSLAEIDLAEDRRALFPLMKDRALGLDLAQGGLRVEALSEVSSPAWDLLVAAGRLDALGLDDVMALTHGKWEDWLLGLAGAYAVYARPSERGRAYLEVVLENLAGLAREGAARAQAVPDLDLLRAAFAPPGRTGLAADVAGRLRPWAEGRAVPVLRWGVTIALRLLADLRDDEPFAGWHEALAAIEPRLSPISVWTAWTEERAGEGPPP